MAAALQMPVAEIERRRPFADYGLDSILGVNLVHTLNTALGTALETIDLFDHGTVERLHAFLVGTYGDALHVQASPAAVAPAPDDDAIAVVGMAARYADAEDPRALWDHLMAGHDLVEPVTRWPLGQDVSCRSGSFVRGIDQFDPVFFAISGVEATTIEKYTYTDISKAFLLYGQREYGEIAPYLDARLFNAEKPLAGQEVEPGEIVYDTLLRRIPGLRPAGPAEDLPLKNDAAIFGLHELPVTWWQDDARERDAVPHPVAPGVPLPVVPPGGTTGLWSAPTHADPRLRGAVSHRRRRPPLVGDDRREGPPFRSRCGGCHTAGITMRNCTRTAPGAALRQLSTRRLASARADRGQAAASQRAP
ncbi:phosphopantetheine-binding protein [Streptomyces sioyaensis]|uniref:acyl carrier protein n=1 Tax=Streptomyces sioyaensis TaxID=67364 RepID=UPI0033FF15E0